MQRKSNSADHTSFSLIPDVSVTSTQYFLQHDLDLNYFVTE